MASPFYITCTICFHLTQLIFYLSIRLRTVCGKLLWNFLNKNHQIFLLEQVISKLSLPDPHLFFQSRITVWKSNQLFLHLHTCYLKTMALISTPFVYIWWNSFTVDSLGNIATAGDDEEPVQILTYSSHPSKIQWHMRNFAWKQHQKMSIGTSCPLFSLPPPQ